MARDWTKLNKLTARKGVITPRYKEIQIRQQAGEDVTASDQAVMDEYMNLQTKIKIVFHSG